MTVARLAFFIHSFIGIKLILILCLVLISGSLNVFHEEIDWLIYAEKRVKPVGPVLPLETLYNQVQTAHPQVHIASIQVEESKRYTAVSMLAHDALGSRRININQYTGEVQGVTPVLTIGQLIDDFHFQLFLPVGRDLVNFFAVIILLSLISGLCAYKNFWRGFFKWPRYGAGIRVFFGDLHRLIALWSIWFVLLISGTGCWWFYNQTVVEYTPLNYSFDNVAFAARELPPETLPQFEGSAPTRLSLSRLVESAKNFYPKLLVDTLLLPDQANKSLRISGNQGELLTRRATNIDVNPYTTELLNMRSAADYNFLQRVNEAMYPLHFGTWAKAGIITLLVKTMWFLFGALLSFLCLSGLIIAVQRSKKTLLEMRASKQKKAPGLVARILFPLGAYKYFNLIIILLVIVGLSLSLLRSDLEDKSVLPSYYPMQDIGPWEVQIGLVTTRFSEFSAGNTNVFTVRLCNDCFSALKSLQIGFLEGEQIVDVAALRGSEVRGDKGYSSARLRLPMSLNENTQLYIRAESWQGNFFLTTWPALQ